LSEEEMSREALSIIDEYLNIKDVKVGENGMLALCLYNFIMRSTQKARSHPFFESLEV